MKGQTMIVELLVQTTQHKKYPLEKLKGPLAATLKSSNHMDIILYYYLKSYDKYYK